MVGPYLAQLGNMRNMRKAAVGIVATVGWLSVSLSCASEEKNQPPQMAQLTRAITPPDRPEPAQPLSNQA